MSEPYVDEREWTENDHIEIKGTVYDLDGSTITTTGATINFIYWFGKKAANKATGAVDGTTGAKIVLDGAGNTPDGIPGHGLFKWYWEIIDTSSPTRTHYSGIYKKEVRKRKMA